MFNIDIDSLKSSDNEIVDVNDREIAIKYNHNGKDLFTVYISRNKERIRFIFKMQLVTNTDEMIYLLEKYRDFFNQTITVNNKKIFGEIITNENMEKGRDNQNIDASLSYWKNIQLLEKKLNGKFKFSMPLSNKETEMLDILVNSFINNKFTYMGNLKDVCILTNNEEQLEAMKGKTENLKLAIKNSSENICGINIGNLYKHIEYIPVKLLNYRKVEDTEMQNEVSKYLLELEEQDNTKTKIGYSYDRNAFPT